MTKQEKLNADLIESSQKGDLEQIKYLIEQGANIHADNNEVLRRSSSRGNLDILKFLVEQGSNINSNDNEALRMSAMRGNLEVVKYLVEHGANINAKNDYALKMSSEREHLEVVKYLVIDCNMVVKKETLTYLKNTNLVDALSIINSSELNSKLENDLNEPKEMNRFKRKV